MFGIVYDKVDMQDGSLVCAWLQNPASRDEVYGKTYNKNCEAIGLRVLSAFVYRAEFDNGLCEYEFDRVIAGRYTGESALGPMSSCPE